MVPPAQKIKGYHVHYSDALSILNSAFDFTCFVPHVDCILLFWGSGRCRRPANPSAHVDFGQKQIIIKKYTELWTDANERSPPELHKSPLNVFRMAANNFLWQSTF